MNDFESKVLEADQQEKEILNKLINYFEEEHQQGGFNISDPFAYTILNLNK